MITSKSVLPRPDSPVQLCTRCERFHSCQKNAVIDVDFTYEGVRVFGDETFDGLVNQALHRSLVFIIVSIVVAKEGLVVSYLGRGPPKLCRHWHQGDRNIWNGPSKRGQLGRDTRWQSPTDLRPSSVQKAKTPRNGRTVERSRTPPVDGVGLTM